MDQSDEEFLRQFAALSSSDEQQEYTVQLPHDMNKQREWQRCLLVRVVSQKVIHEDQFVPFMRAIWKVHPDTEFEAMGGNYFMLECVIEEDLHHILDKGVWNYHGDMVISRLAKGQEDAVSPNITEVDCWVEIHGLPPDAITTEGTQMLMNSIGKPLSDLINFFHIGKRVHKQKIQVDLDKPVKDRMQFPHPAFGKIEIHIVYDGVTGICMFRGIVGHDNTRCPKRARLIRLQASEEYANRPEVQNIPTRRIGLWVNNRMLIPRGRKEEGGFSGLRGESSGSGSSVQEERRGQNQPGSVQTNRANNTGIGKSTRQKLLKRALNTETDTIDKRDALDIRGNKIAIPEPNHNQNQINYKRAKETNPNSSPSYQ